MSRRAGSVFVAVLVLLVPVVLGLQVWWGLKARGCSDHCFPFASRWEPVSGCFCADLGDTWHPDDW